MRSGQQRLLLEWMPLEVSPALVEESKRMNGGKIVLRGTMQKADAPNQNGRVYPKKILEREVKNFQKLISENRAVGECDHPSSSVVSLKNVSHIVRELRVDGNTVFGSIELLNTPSGKILQDLINDGVKLGVSSRGVGSTTKKGEHDYVNEDFTLICFDAVAEPSVTSAFLSESLLESVDINLKNFFSKSDRIYRAANSVLQIVKRD